MKLSHMQHLSLEVTGGMVFLRSTCDMGIRKRRLHATWTLFKFETENGTSLSIPLDWSLARI